MSKPDTFGWDLLYKVTQPQIKTEQDILIAICHWKLIRQGFKCIGIGLGEGLGSPKPEDQTEILPEGWNSSGKYIIRYINEGKIFILNGILSEGILNVSLVKTGDNTGTEIVLNTSLVRGKNGSLAKMIPFYENLITKIETELISPLNKIQPSKDSGTQTAAQIHTQRSFNRANLFSSPHATNPQYYNTSNDTRQPGIGNPFGSPIGRSDIDPFAPPGGGMLFQPPGFGPTIPAPIDPMMPLGAVPPGARFDPLRPPAPGPQRTPGNPDNDHLPPSGFDDMFM